MLIETKGNKAVGDLSLKSGKSSISQDKLHKIIGLLSSQYSDPIGSMLREYTSNIHDSYIGTGKDPHGIVSLWKDNEKNQDYLSFKDNGSGLSPDMFEKVFIVYGESTKDNDNQAIGGFGLGSKTCFAYTNSIMIITRYEGKKYTYYYYKGDKGIPEYDLLSEVDTKEENGTEIRVPIKYGDTYRVRQSVNQLMYFDNIYLEGFGHDNTTKIVEGKNFKYKEGTSLAPHVCLEKVYYPLPPEFLNKARTKHMSGVGYYNFSNINLPVALKFNNGELKPTISRESFEYNEQIEELLFERLDATIEELKEIYQRNNDLTFEEDYSLIDYFSMNQNKLDFDFNGVFLTLDNKHSGLDLKWKHKLLENTFGLEITGGKLAAAFIITNELNNSGSITSVLKTFGSVSYINGYFLKDVPTISTRGIKAAYIRDTFSFFKVIKQRSLTLRDYKEILRLYSYSRKHWRACIIAYQKCLENVKNSLTKVSEIEPDEEYIKKYKEREQRKKDNAEVKFTYISDTPSYSDLKNLEIKAKHFISINKTRQFIYGENKYTKGLEKANVLSSLLPNLFVVKVRNKDLEKLESHKKFIHIKDLLNVENIRIIRNAIKAYQLIRLRKAYQLKIAILEGVNDWLYVSFSRYMTMDKNSNSNLYISDLKHALYEEFKEHRDTELEKFHQELDEYFEGVPLLKFLKNDHSTEFCVSLASYLKSNKKRVNKEYYLKLNTEEEEWIKTWEKDNTYFLSVNTAVSRLNESNLKQIQLISNELQNNRQRINTDTAA